MDTETHTWREGDVKAQEPCRERLGAVPPQVKEHRVCLHQQIGERLGEIIPPALRFHPPGSVRRSEYPASAAFWGSTQCRLGRPECCKISMAEWLGEAGSTEAGVGTHQRGATQCLRGHPTNQKPTLAAGAPHLQNPPLAQGQG